MSYLEAKEKYAKIGVDTDKAIETLKNVPVSLHCWQGDDVVGFDQKGALSGGIQTTGNYLGRARTPDELMTDIDKVISLVPGKMKLNLHACYAILTRANLPTETNLNQSILQSGCSLQRKEIWVLTSTRLSFLTLW